MHGGASILRQECCSAFVLKGGIQDWAKFCEAFDFEDPQFRGLELLGAMLKVLQRVFLLEKPLFISERTVVSGRNPQVLGKNCLSESYLIACPHKSCF